jgi:hypothetical protein
MAAPMMLAAPLSVMAGLVPAIHDSASAVECWPRAVDARDKPGHDKLSFLEER